ncbi:uncharacterized protein LOC130743479 [Lotus japonicus]|uniref:uncharacterized protein LOC130743479 n=1 Tax=Lotus japonicus TaxID=34305 RepID=UPI002589B7E4|nr:uncharacterized protein LOC130743479 [Lotus japonicus]
MPIRCVLCIIELHLNQEEILDLDLNQISEDEPDFTESEYGQIQARFRHIQAITARAMERRQNPSSVQSPAHLVSEQSVAESKVGVKKIYADVHLVAKALKMVELDLERESKLVDRIWNIFDCNICLKMAREPVVTCCGHLYCWPCFYILPYPPYSERECPVCYGEVTEENLVPIYGQTNSGERDLQLEYEKAGLRIPPRPAARREVSVLEQLLRAGVPPAIAELYDSIFDELVQIESPIQRRQIIMEMLFG